MELKNQTWVALVDSRHGRLLRCGLTPQGRCHLEECDAIENTWPGHEHHRPSPLWGKTGETYAAEGKETEEELARFVRQVVDWLEQKTGHNTTGVALFAPPRFLGALRRVQSKHLAERLQEKKGELIHLPLGELAEHPAIRKLLGLQQ